MSDYPKSNITRSNASSGRGLLIALAVIVGAVAVLAFVGALGGGDDGGVAPSEDVIVPAPATPVLPTE